MVCEKILKCEDFLLVYLDLIDFQDVSWYYATYHIPNKCSGIYILKMSHQNGVYNWSL